jgi:predicted small integral membrane protein
MKIVIVITLIAVLGALGSAGLFMLRRPPASDVARPADKRMAWALALRVAVSVALFLLILLAWQLGWIAPKGLPTGR